MASKDFYAKPKAPPPQKVSYVKPKSPRRKVDYAKPNGTPPDKVETIDNTSLSPAKN